MKEFYLKQKVFSLRSRYRVLDENEEQLYHCVGKIFSLSRELNFYNTKNEKHLYQMNRKIFAIMPTYFLYNAQGEQVAKARRKFSIGKKLVSIESDHGDFEIEGNFWAHDFRILKDGERVATIQKKYISFGDSYQIQIEDESNTEFFLAMLVMIDAKFHSRRKSSRNR